MPREKISGIIDEGVGLFKDVLNFLKGIGDQVPNYPIRSRTTMQSIVDNLNLNFPTPNTVTAAQNYLLEAQRWKDEADTKVRTGEGSRAVNETYSLMLADIIKVYEAYILGSHPPLPGGGGVEYVPPAGGTGPPPTSHQQAGMSTTSMIIIGAIAAGLLFAKKR